MAKRVQRRRGTTTEHGSFTGAVGEITVDTTKDTVAVHDGAVAGGFPLAREDMNNVTNRIGVTQLNCAEGTNGQVLSTNGSGTISFSTVDATTAVVGGDLSGSVGNAQIVANAVTATELATNAVTTIKITDLNVTAGKLAADAVTTTKILNANVTEAKLANSAVTSAKILDGTIVAGDLASNAVTTIKILDGNVTDAKLASNAVTTAKINADAVDGTKLADNACDSEHYTDGSVDNVHLATGIDAAKLTTGTLPMARLSGTLPALNGSALTDMVYDIAFTAGFDKDMVKEDVAVATYGELVMARAGTFVGEYAYIDTAPTGATCIVDIEKNGSTIYSTKPLFATSSTGVTAGVLTVTTFAVSDRITFKVTQKGSTEPGEGLRFTLKCKV